MKMNFITNIRIITAKNYFLVEVKTIEADVKDLKGDEQAREIVITGTETAWTPIQVIPALGSMANYN
jgi:hypothetical protein